MVVHHRDANGPAKGIRNHTPITSRSASMAGEDYTITPCCNLKGGHRMEGFHRDRRSDMARLRIRQPWAGPSISSRPTVQFVQSSNKRLIGLQGPHTGTPSDCFAWLGLTVVNTRPSLNNVLL